MARSQLATGTIVFDCEGLSRVLNRDRRVLSIIADARQRGARRVLCGATLTEAISPQYRGNEWDYALSQFDVTPMTVPWFTQAADLLLAHNLSGHKYAIDAMVAVTALHQPGHVVILTSDADDLTRLCDGKVTVAQL